MSSSPKLPWVVKYRPKKLDDYVDQDEAKSALVAWIKEWLSGRIPSKKAVLLYGPPGTGKTSLVEALAGEFGLDIVEMNASDFRRKEDIERIVLRASKQLSLSGRRRIILLDEVDGLSGIADKGAIEGILELIRDTRHPVILTANDPWSQSLKPLRDAALMLQVRRLRMRDILSVLKRICDAEKIYCEDAGLKVIYERNQGDLRACINDLQAIAETYGRVTESLAKTLTYYRDRELDPFETLRKVFTSRYAWQAKSAVTHSQLDYDMLAEWFNENIPVQLTDPEDMLRAFDALSRADVYRSRIIRSGSWDLLSYVIDMLGPGIAFSRKRTKFKWVGYKFPQKIRMLSETKERREKLNRAARKIAEETHTSIRTALAETIPVLRAIYRADPEMGAGIMKYLGIAPDEAIVITGDDAVKKYMEKVKVKPVTSTREESVAESPPRALGDTGVTDSTQARGESRARSRSRRRKRPSGGQKTLF